MRSLMILCLGLALFQNARAETAGACADALLEHLGTNQSFSSTNKLADLLQKREAATLLVRMVPNALSAPISQVLTLGLPADGPVVLREAFTVLHGGDFFFVLDGKSADLKNAIADAEARFKRASFGFQILGSTSSTREFQIKLPSETIEMASTEDGYAAVEKEIGDTNARFNLYVEGALELVHVIKKDEITGLDRELFDHLGFKGYQVTEGMKLGEYLTINAAILEGTVAIVYRDHVILSGKGLRALKKLAGESTLAPSNVNVSEMLRRELESCTKAVCKVATPSDVVAAFEAPAPVKAAPPVDTAPEVAPPPVVTPRPVAPSLVTPATAAAPSGIEYPIFPPAEDIGTEEIDVIGDVLRSIGNKKLPKDVVEIRERFVGILDNVQPENHARHEKILADIAFKDKDMGNGRVKGAAQNRLLSALRALADALDGGTYQPTRRIDRASVYAVAKRYAASINAAKSSPVQNPEVATAPVTGPPVAAAPVVETTPAAPIAEAPASTAVAPQTARAEPTAPAALPKFNLNFKPMTFKSSAWSAERKGEFLYHRERRGVWATRPLALVTHYDLPYYLAVQMNWAKTTSVADVVDKLVNETKLNLPAELRKWITLALTEPAQFENVSFLSTFGAVGATKLRDLNQAYKPFFLVPKEDLPKPRAEQHRVLMIPLQYSSEGAFITPPQAPAPTIEPAPEVKTPAAESPSDLASVEATPALTTSPIDAYLLRNLRYALKEGDSRLKIVHLEQGTSKLIRFTEEDGRILDKRESSIDADSEKKIWENVSNEHAFEPIKVEFSAPKPLAGKNFENAYLARATVARLTVRNGFDEIAIKKMIARIASADGDGHGNLVTTVNVNMREWTVSAAPVGKRLVILDVKPAN